MNRLLSLASQHIAVGLILLRMLLSRIQQPGSGVRAVIVPATLIYNLMPKIGEFCQVRILCDGGFHRSYLLTVIAQVLVVPVHNPLLKLKLCLGLGHL